MTYYPNYLTWVSQTRIFCFLKLLLVLLSVCSCSSSVCRQWEIQKVLTKHPCYNAGRLLWGPHSNFTYLELELARSRTGLRFYVNLLFLQARPCQEDSERTCLEILYDNQESWVVYPYLFEGGQRLLLPGEVADVLIQALLNGRSFTVRLGRNCLEILPANFASLYETLLSLPIEVELY